MCGPILACRLQGKDAGVLWGEVASEGGPSCSKRRTKPEPLSSSNLRIITTLTGITYGHKIVRTPHLSDLRSQARSGPDSSAVGEHARSRGAVVSIPSVVNFCPSFLFPEVSSDPAWGNIT